MKVLSFVVSIGLAFKLAFGQATTCDDAYECDGSTITTTYAYCYGYYGCNEADITSSYVYNFGPYASYLAEITAVSIYNYGFRAGYYADIKATNIHSYGFYAANYADIEPRTNTLVAYFYGFYSGYYADVSCYDGDNCKIYCGAAFGCYNMDFYCYSGATCLYDCGNDPNYCPNLIGGIESELTDDEITAMFQKKKKIKEKKMKEDPFGIDDPNAPQLPVTPRDHDDGASYKYTKQNGLSSSVSYNLFGESQVVIIGGIMFVYAIGVIFAVKHYYKPKEYQVLT